MKKTRSSWGFREEAADGAPFGLSGATHQVLEGCLQRGWGFSILWLLSTVSECPPSTALRDSGILQVPVEARKADTQLHHEAPASGHTCAAPDGIGTFCVISPLGQGFCHWIQTRSL